MTVLDDTRRHAALDPGGMRDLVAALPAQSREAWAAGLAWEMPAGFRTPRRVVVAGVGGSASGADMVAAIAARSSAVPVQVYRGYTPPAIDEHTLVVACSFSGETEETLAAFRSTLGRPGMRLAITTGGRLAEEAAGGGYSLFRYRWDGPPRSAFGYGLFPLLAILRRLDVVAITDDEVEAAINALDGCARQWAPDVPERSNPAKRLASAISGRAPVIAGAGLLAPAAGRWAAQMSENAKQWAFSAALPEADHNLIVGFASPPPLREWLHVVLLDAAPVHQRNRLRARLTAEALERAGVPHEVVSAGGETALEALLRACYLGDWVSLYAALLNGVDPTPVAPIDELKRALATEA